MAASKKQAIKTLVSDEIIVAWGVSPRSFKATDLP